MRNDYGKPVVHLPPFAPHDCQLCGWCCRSYWITFSEDERRELLRKDWDALAPQTAGRPWYGPTGKRPPHDPWQLAPLPDGRCPFLTDDLRCAMHAHVGVMGKPLPCAVFPYTLAFTPSGVYVGLRYSCPAAARGQGTALETRRPFFEELVERLRRLGRMPIYRDPVDFDGTARLAWDDYLRLEDALIATLLRADLPLTHRVVMAWRLVGLVGEVFGDGRRGTDFAGRLQDLVGSLGLQFARLAMPQPALLRRERVLFRQFAHLFHRRTGPAYFTMGIGRRLRQRARWLMEGVRFARGRGRVPLPETDRDIRLEEVEGVSLPPFDAEQAGLLSRYLAGKLFAKHAFGRLLFNYSFRSGFTFLTLAYAAVLWYARAVALAAGRAAVATEDLVQAVRVVDFCYGYSKAPALLTERLRVWALGQNDSAARLAVAWGPREDAHA